MNIYPHGVVVDGSPGKKEGDPGKEATKQAIFLLG